MDFYVRQFRDMKVIPSSEQVTPFLRQFGIKCGDVLARAHASTGDAAAIDAYIGKGDAFDEAMARFASAYAEQNRARPRAARRRHPRRRARQRAGLVMLNRPP